VVTISFRLEWAAGLLIYVCIGILVAAFIVRPDASDYWSGFLLTVLLWPLAVILVLYYGND